MDLSEIKDIASIVFFALGALAVALGAPLALRRLFLEQPYAPSWEREIDESTVRQIQEGPDKGGYIFSVLVHITNRSQSVQKVLGYWLKVSMPSGGPFVGIDTEFRNSDEVQEFFDCPITEVNREYPPNTTFSIGQHVVHTSLEHVLHLNYCFETRSRRLLWLGYEQKPRFNRGTLMIPVRLDDIKHYARDADASPPPVTPPAVTP